MASKHLETLDQIMHYGASKGIGHDNAFISNVTGRTINVRGEQVVNFGSCSYLGLELHNTLREGAIEATRKYGTQFSSSRTYASVELYAELENLLQEIYGKPVLVSASTTLGHLATLPVIIGDNDAIIMDMQVHSSVQMASQLLKARNVPISIIRHNDMEALSRKIKEFGSKAEKIWFLTDGIFSMYGDAAPFAELEQLLKKHPKLHLYIDDAHGTGWAGQHGCGYVRSKMEHHDRMVMTASLNKSFAAAGGAVIFPNEEMKTLVRHCGGTMIFSGPVQPPMLGAAIASAKLHLSEEIRPIQDRVQHLIDYTNDKIAEWGLPQFEVTDSPIFFIPVGLPNIVMDFVCRLLDEGLQINPGVFPATPMKRGGLRFMVNGHLTEADIDRLIERIAFHYENVLAEAGSSSKDVARTFRIAEFEVKSPERTLPLLGAAHVEARLDVEHATTIADVDQQAWDATFHGKGNINAASLAMLEEVFSNNTVEHDNWEFHYFRVRDQKGNTILKTFFTTATVKDDMFASAEASMRIEQQRITDPTFLTSKAIILGSQITKGEQLFLDREHALWKPALKALVHAMQEQQERVGANQILMGTFTGERDQELDNVFIELGLARFSLPNSNHIENISWNGHDDYIASIKRRYRSDFRREIAAHGDKFRVVTERPTTRKEIEECYALFRNVFEKSYEMNMHRLPKRFFEAAFRHKDYHVVRLYLKEEETPGEEGSSPRPLDQQEPVAFTLSHHDSATCSALLVGLNYEFLRSHETYKQILYRTVWNAWSQGVNKIDLAFTADMVKKKVGAKPISAYTFVQAADHFNHAVVAVS